MADENRIRVIYSGEKSLYDIIAEILAKNNLKETLNEGIQNINQGKISKIETVSKITDNLVLGKTTEKDAMLLMQTQLGATPDIAQGILQGIKERLLPLAEKITSEKTQKRAPEDTPSIIETNTPPAPMHKDQTRAPVAPIIKEAIKTKTRVVKSPTKLPETKPEVKKITRSGPDRYREPIE